MRLPFPYRPEGAVVSQSLSALSGVLHWPDVVAQATPWVDAVRRHPPPFWAMESLLQEYPISRPEGLALMRLAEALLRVPDTETAIALTADQLGRAEFDGSGDTALGRLAGTAIALSKKFLPEASGEVQPAPDGPTTGGESSLMVRLGARTVVAATLRAVQLLGRQFVLGQSMAEAQHEATKARKDLPALRYSYDMLGEGARTADAASRYLDRYRDAIDAIARTAQAGRACEDNDGISIKLSALHPRFEDAQRERVLAELVPGVWTLCDAAARANINLTIDAEEVDRLELSLDVFEALADRVAQQHPGWRGFGLALQAYQSRALELVEHVIQLARQRRLRLMCRLVKGAYWDAEIKRAQELGLPHYPVFTHKHHTDINYLACARAMLQAPDAIYPQFATHNAASISAILQMTRALQDSGAPVGFEMQRLHGMGEGLYREVLRQPGVACRVYAPVGAHRDLLAYLVRRLLENGANSSFVHQLVDESVGMDALLRSPLRLDTHPSLPLPPALYGDGVIGLKARRNSGGLDLSVASQRAPLHAAHATQAVPQVPLFDEKLAHEAYAVSARCYRKWSATPVAARGAMLRRAADVLEQQLPEFCALLVKEAFKTWGDAVSEVREAVDFLRYYAGEAERLMLPLDLPVVDAGAGHIAVALGLTGETNVLRLKPRGVWVAISPWNFPLAIFMGQVAAALATGNTVLAKPAEQTPGVARQAVAVLHAAGVPADAVQLLHGPGETVGAALVALPGVAGVVFTGSTAVAKIIQRALAAKDGPIVPLIAETGGINAMLVDSTALPEQVVDAVVQSAFRSAGQRCSALRLLCLHDTIADDVMTMLAGAMRELVAGDPAQWATDLGPVIDREAFEGIQRHLVRLRATARDITARGASDGAGEPRAASHAPAPEHLIAPQAFEVGSIDDVRHEIFGPVLQIVRWSGEPLDVIARINALGFGLTLGIQTRIDSRAQALAQAAHVGNVYINRNMIGAVVGVQPFGGEGLSGTGPKAGGPHYLARFCAEQTVTVNTVAAGGNVQLLAR